ncbi:MAG: [Fe-Fe] hydrogenase large subunit C-terminal domain-containing protein, partial [Clostridiaceae bacterium]
YNAIIQYDRPCAQACGVNAIDSDHLGRAKINQDKCVSCGQCIQKCPFGAIADKSEIYQLIKSMKAGGRHLAIVAPSFISQFGPVVTPEQIFEGIRLLGFDGVMEVGLGADIETIKEAREYLHEVPASKPYMGTSCCPSWAMMVKKMFPEEDKNISSSATPMIATAQHIKREDFNAKVTFIGPCISKKLEALQDNVKDYVDFVLTYEELMGMFIAKSIELTGLEVSAAIDDSSSLGRGFAESGGVAGAVAAVVAQLEPDRTVLTEKANGLHECVKLMKLAKAGKKNGYLLEGMACPGGCLGGPGTLAPILKAQRALAAFKEKAAAKSPLDNPKIQGE